MVGYHVLKDNQNDYREKWLAIDEWAEGTANGDLGIAYCIALSHSSADDVRIWFRFFTESMSCEECMDLRYAAHAKWWKKVGRFIPGADEDDDIDEGLFETIHCEECEECLSYRDHGAELEKEIWSAADICRHWPPLTDEHQPDQVVDFDNRLSCHSQYSDVWNIWLSDENDKLWERVKDFRVYLQDQSRENTFFTPNEHAALRQLGMDCWIGCRSRENLDSYDRQDYPETKHRKTMLVFSELPQFIQTKNCRFDATDDLSDSGPIQPTTRQLDTLRRVMEELCLTLPEDDEYGRGSPGYDTTKAQRALQVLSLYPKNGSKRQSRWTADT